MTSSVRIRFAVLLALLLALLCCTAASAGDADLTWELPGVWSYDTDGEEGTVTLGYLTLEEDGTMELLCCGSGYVCRGAWSLEIVTEDSPVHGSNDRLILQFTSTDDPACAGQEYRVDCVYYVYAESWAENSTRITWLLFDDEAECSGVSPLGQLDAEDMGISLHKEEGPNMVVVNCSSFVSLREQRSTKAARLARVPLGARVFAFPEDVPENGFIRCVYGDEYGYILLEYLMPLAEANKPE